MSWIQMVVKDAPRPGRDLFVPPAAIVATYWLMRPVHGPEDAFVTAFIVGVAARIWALAMYRDLKRPGLLAAAVLGVGMASAIAAFATPVAIQALVVSAILCQGLIYFFDGPLTGGRLAARKWAHPDWAPVRPALAEAYVGWLLVQAAFTFLLSVAVSHGVWIAWHSLSGLVSVYVVHLIGHWVWARRSV